MAKKKHSALGKRLIASAKEMAAHARGRVDLDVHQVEVPPQVDVIAIRKRLAIISVIILPPFRIQSALRAGLGRRAAGCRRAPRAHTCWSLHGNRQAVDSRTTWSGVGPEPAPWHRPSRLRWHGIYFGPHMICFDSCSLKSGRLYESACENHNHTEMAPRDVDDFLVWSISTHCTDTRDFQCRTPHRLRT